MRTTRAGALAATIVATATVLVGLTGQADACSCLAQTEEAQFAQAAAVFGGTPVSRRDASLTAVDWTFAVDEILKPSVDTPVQVVRSASNSAACGIEFQIGTRYLVYAFRSDGMLAAGLCSGTRAASQPVPTTATPPTTLAATPSRLRLTG